MPFNSNISKEGDYLNFLNVSTLESTLIQIDALNYSILNIWELYYPGYTSIRKQYYGIELLAFNQDAWICPEQDPSVGTLVNQDGIVRIVSSAFLLDYSTNSVYEVYPVNTATITLLKQKNEINNDTMYIFKYSMNDEVLHPSGFEPVEELKMAYGDNVKVKHCKKTGENGGWKKSDGECCFNGNSLWKKRCDNFGGVSSTCIPNQSYPSTERHEILYREGSKLSRIKSIAYFYMTRMDGYIPKTIYSRRMEVIANLHISW